MKMKKAVGGRLGLFGSFPFLPFFSTLAFFGFGSVDEDFFLHSPTQPNLTHKTPTTKKNNINQTIENKNNGYW